MKSATVFRPVAVILTVAVLFLAAWLPAWAQTKKSEPAVKTVAPPTAVQIPEITRIAVYQGHGGETFLSSPLAIARDQKNGDLMVTSFESGEVVILDRNGALVKRLGRESGLLTPYGVAIDAKGRIYVTEVKSGHLKVLSPSGAMVDDLDLSRIMGKTVSPGRILLGGDGLLYLTDLSSNEILLFNDRGDFVKSLGKSEYLQKAGVINEGRVLSLSAQGKAVRIFGKEGTLLLSFGDHGDAGEANVSFPTGFAVDAKGRLWIADAFQHRLKVFSLDGTFLFNFGRMEEKAGGFFFPVDLCFGEADELFVLEKGAHRIQVFRIGDLKGQGHEKR